MLPSLLGLVYCVSHRAQGLQHNDHEDLNAYLNRDTHFVKMAGLPSFPKFDIHTDENSLGI